MADAEHEQRLSWHWLLPASSGGTTQISGFSPGETKILVNALGCPSNKKQSLNPTRSTHSTEPEINEDDPDTLPELVVINIDKCDTDHVKLNIEKTAVVALTGLHRNLGGWHSYLSEYEHIKEYGLLPASQPRVIIPLGNRQWTRTALGLHRPGRWIARLGVEFARFMYRFGSFNFLFQRRLIIASHELTDLTPHGAVIAGIALEPSIHDHDFALYLGTADANRKTVILPVGNGKPEHIIKLAEKPQARQSLEREAMALTTVANSTLATQVPRLLSCHKTEKSISLDLEYRARHRISGSRMQTAVQDFMIALAKFDAYDVTLSDWLENSPIKPDTLNSDERALLLTLKKTAMQGTLLRLHRVHGDFAPWNCSWTLKGLFVFDWEESRSDGLALSDYCHYMLAPALLISSSQQPETIVDRILSEMKVFSKHIGLQPEAIPLHLSVWLLQWAAGREAPVLDKLRHRLRNSIISNEC